MEYRKQLRQAVRRTRKWGMASPGVDVFETQMASARTYGQWAADPDFQDLASYLSVTMELEPAFRRKLCAFVHLHVSAYFLSEGIDEIPILTIGDVVWDGDSCFDTTPESLKSLVAEGRESRSTVDAHAWLTFPDMSIVDFTFPLWQAANNGIEPDLADPRQGCLLGQAGAIPLLAYRPMLVGPGFCAATRWCDDDLVSKYRQTEALWLLANG